MRRSATCCAPRRALRAQWCSTAGPIAVLRASNSESARGSDWLSKRLGLLRMESASQPRARTSTPNRPRTAQTAIHLARARTSSCFRRTELRASPTTPTTFTFWELANVELGKRDVAICFLRAFFAGHLARTLLRSGKPAVGRPSQALTSVAEPSERCAARDGIGKNANSNMTRPAGVYISVQYLYTCHATLQPRPSC